MKESDVRARAFAMPLTSPAYPVGRTVSSIANSSSSLTGPIHRNCANWSPSRCRQHSGRES